MEEMKSFQDSHLHSVENMQGCNLIVGGLRISDILGHAHQ